MKAERNKTEWKPGETRERGRGKSEIVGVVEEDLRTLAINIWIQVAEYRGM